MRQEEDWHLWSSSSTALEGDIHNPECWRRRWHRRRWQEDILHQLVGVTGGSLWQSDWFSLRCPQNWRPPRRMVLLVLVTRPPWSPTTTTVCTIEWTTQIQKYGDKEKTNISNNKVEVAMYLQEFSKHVSSMYQAYSLFMFLVFQNCFKVF